MWRLRDQREAAGTEPAPCSSSHHRHSRGEHKLMHAQTARRLRTLALTLVAGLVAFAVLSGPASASAHPPSGVTLTWSDEFNGAAGTGVNTTNWKYDTGPGSRFGTGEIETMTS